MIHARESVPKRVGGGRAGRSCYRGAEGWREREGEREAERKSHDGGRERRGRVRGTALSVATHVLFPRPPRVLVKRNGGRASGCTTVVHTPRPDTRVILYISARARVPARDGEGYTPRCYPLGHSISRVRGTLVVTLESCRVASRHRVSPRLAATRHFRLTEFSPPPEQGKPL